LRRGLAYVPQGRIVFPQMTVLENLEMGAYTVRDEARIADALERVYALFPILRERHGQKAGTMSGGEQQMVAIGRALMTAPRLILLDEPSLGLSPKFVALIFDRLVEMKRAGYTLALVEQNAARALAIADRGYVLELGKNRLEGRGAALLHRAQRAGAVVDLVAQDRPPHAVGDARREPLEPRVAPRGPPAAGGVPAIEPAEQRRNVRRIGLEVGVERDDDPAARASQACGARG